ncbi:MAG TPA: carboxymuconolactone decarboxylase family protein [Trebonia sp.]
MHGHPVSISGQVQAFVSSFALIIVGLFIAGPWLTMAAARAMARWTSRAGTLIAARRIADDPKAAFRAVSGLVLALFVTTVAVVAIGTQDVKDLTRFGMVAESNMLSEQVATSRRTARPSPAAGRPHPPRLSPRGWTPSAWIPSTWERMAAPRRSSRRGACLRTRAPIPCSARRPPLAIGVVEGCDGCIASHAQAAAIAGATRQEAAEAICVTFLMKGGPATIYGPRAYDAFCEFAKARETGEHTA